MTNERMLDIINYEPSSGNVSDEESIEAYKMFFKKFNVDLNNEDGSYKSLYDIFKEAHDNITK